jgi:hypothetical protein
MVFVAKVEVYIFCRNTIQKKEEPVFFDLCAKRRELSWDKRRRGQNGEIGKGKGSPRGPKLQNKSSSTCTCTCTHHHHYQLTYIFMALVAVPAQFHQQ